jgi:hypothetical protein
MTASARIRSAVILRDGPACRYCGAILVLPWQTVTLDHLTPISKGGSNEVSNLVIACSHCNSSKGGRTLEESGMVLFPPGFFAEAILQARKHLASLGIKPELRDCLECGTGFDAMTTYDDEICAVRRAFCCREHAVSYTMKVTAKKEATREFQRNAQLAKQMSQGTDHRDPSSGGRIVATR